MKLFFRLFQDLRKESSRRRRARGRYRTDCELLECRTLLASVMDSGTTLQIELEGSERLQIVADSSSYTFTSFTSSFSDSGVTDATDFAGFGTGNLTFNDFAQYSRLEFFDAAPGASVEFLDSASNSFQHDIDITLDAGAASHSVIFRGDFTFGNQSLSATVDSSIKLLNGSRLSVVNGNITLTAHNQTDGSEQRRGIDVGRGGGGRESFSTFFCVNNSHGQPPPKNYPQPLTTEKDSRPLVHSPTE